METVITLPKGKTIRMGDERYKTTRPVDVPADTLAPSKKQVTRMKKLECPHCGFVGRATLKYRNRILVCGGTEEQQHDPTFLVWTDSDTSESSGAED